MRIGIHDVESIEIKKTKRLAIGSKGVFFTRDIVIKSAEGKQTITLFSDVKDTLKL